MTNQQNRGRHDGFSIAIFDTVTGKIPETIYGQILQTIISITLWLFNIAMENPL
jgi:hypothetical protein